MNGPLLGSLLLGELENSVDQIPPPTSPQTLMLRLEWGVESRPGKERPLGLQCLLHPRSAVATMGSGLPLVLLLTLLGSSHGTGEG